MNCKNFNHQSLSKPHARWFGYVEWKTTHTGSSFLSQQSTQDNLTRKVLAYQLNMNEQYNQNSKIPNKITLETSQKAHALHFTQHFVIYIGSRQFKMQATYNSTGRNSHVTQRVLAVVSETWSLHCTNLQSHLDPNKHSIFYHEY